jgi:hypothetical protein
MNRLFRTTVVETSGVRTIAGGGTNASNAGQALSNLSGVSITGNQTISGVKTFATEIFAPNLVYITGNQTVSGIKNFQSIPLVSGKEVYFQKDVKSFTGNNFTPNANEARVFEYVLTGIAGATATLNAPTNMFNGDNILIEIQQSPSGSNSMVFNSSYKFPGGVTPSLTFEANRVDIYTVLKIGSNFYSTYVKDFTN